MDRDVWKARLKEQIAKADQALRNLDAEARVTQAQNEVRAAELRAELRRSRDRARNRLEELSTAGGKAWDDLKEGVSKAYEDLRSAMS